MNYQQNYYDYIKYVKKLNRRKIDSTLPNYVYYENHHILPKSIGGSEDVDNLVLLTAREHFLAHYLLCKFTLGEDRYKMLGAFHMMNNTKERGNRYCNSKLYSRIKEEYRQSISDQFSGKNHYNYGKSLSQETKDKIGSSMKGKCAGEKSYWYKRPISEELTEKRRIGRTGKCTKEEHPQYGKPLSEETKLKISKTLKGRYRGEESPTWGRKYSDEERKKMSEILQAYYKENESPSKGIKRSPESIQKMIEGHAKSTKNKGANHYNYRKKRSKETNDKICEKLRLNKGKDHGNYGKVRSEESKLKYSLARKGKFSGINAPTFGKVRIFSVLKNKYELVIPFGRSMTIDLSKVPKLKVNAYDWKNSIDLFIPFNYYGYEDSFLIKGYDKKNRVLLISLNNRTFEVFSTYLLENKLSSIIKSGFGN